MANATSSELDATTQAYLRLIGALPSSSPGTASTSSVRSVSPTRAPSPVTPLPIPTSVNPATIAAALGSSVEFLVEPQGRSLTALDIRNTVSLEGGGLDVSDAHISDPEERGKALRALTTLRNLKSDLDDNDTVGAKAKFLTLPTNYQEYIKGKIWAAYSGTVEAIDDFGSAAFDAKPTYLLAIRLNNSGENFLNQLLLKLESKITPEPAPPRSPSPTLSVLSTTASSVSSGDATLVTPSSPAVMPVVTALDLDEVVVAVEVVSDFENPAKVSFNYSYTNVANYADFFEACTHLSSLDNLQDPEDLDKTILTRLFTSLPLAMRESLQHAAWKAFSRERGTGDYGKEVILEDPKRLVLITCEDGTPFLEKIKLNIESKLPKFKPEFDLAASSKKFLEEVDASESSAATTTIFDREKVFAQREQSILALGALFETIHPEDEEISLDDYREALNALDRKTLDFLEFALKNSWTFQSEPEATFIKDSLQHEPSLLLGLANEDGEEIIEQLINHFVSLPSDASSLTDLVARRNVIVESAKTADISTPFFTEAATLCEKSTLSINYTIQEAELGESLTHSIELLELHNFISELTPDTPLTPAEATEFSALFTRISPEDQLYFLNIISLKNGQNEDVKTFYQNILSLNELSKNLNSLQMLIDRATLQKNATTDPFEIATYQGNIDRYTAQFAEKRAAIDLLKAKTQELNTNLTKNGLSILIDNPRVLLEKPAGSSTSFIESLQEHRTSTVILLKAQLAIKEILGKLNTTTGLVIDSPEFAEVEGLLGSFSDNFGSNSTFRPVVNIINKILAREIDFKAATPKALDTVLLKIYDLLDQVKQEYSLENAIIKLSSAISESEKIPEPADFTPKTALSPPVIATPVETLAKTMNVMYIAGECNGIATTGGMGPAVLEMAQGLKEKGVKVSVFVPKYSHIKSQKVKDNLVRIGSVKHLFGGVEHTSDIYKSEVEGVTVYLMDDTDGVLPGEDAEYIKKGKHRFDLEKNGALYDFDSDGERGDYDGQSLERFSFFGSGAAAFIQALGSGEFQSADESVSGPGELTHTVYHDFHGTLAAEIIRQKQSKEWRAGKTPATSYIIHNAGYGAQGFLYGWRTTILRGCGLDSSDTLLAGRMLDNADASVAVSKTYAEEIQTSLEGKGLDPLARRAAKEGRLFGVTNGTNLKKWNPSLDPVMKEWIDLEEAEEVDLTFSVDSESITKSKKAIKKQLQGWLKAQSFGRSLIDTYGLNLENDKIMLYVGRFDSSQKGVDKFEAVLEEAKAQGATLIVMGTKPDPESDRILHHVRDRARAMKSDSWGGAWIIDDSDGLPIQLGKDGRVGIGTLLRSIATFNVFPSLYEPCGLVQLEGFQYGVPAVVTDVGGLSDTVHEPTDVAGAVAGVDNTKFTGFKFKREQDWNSAKQTENLKGAIRRAFAYWDSKTEEQRDKLMKNIMVRGQQMSWTTAPDGEMSPTDLHIYALEQATKNKVKRGRSMIITPSLLRV